MMLPVTDVLKRVGQPIGYYPLIARMLGDVKTAVFICYFIFKNHKQDPQGWIEGRRKTINEDTGLSRYEQEHAIKKLEELGIMESKRMGLPARLCYRFYWPKLDELLSVEKKEEKPAKLRPDPETEKKGRPMYLRMKEVWSEHYLKHTEIPYEWSKGKRGGMDAGFLSFFTSTFRRRLWDIKKKANPDITMKQDEVPDDEVVSAFNEFLKNVPKTWKDKFFTLGQFRKYFNNIINEIANERKKSNSESAGDTGDGANRFLKDGATHVQPGNEPGQEDYEDEQGYTNA